MRLTLDLDAEVHRKIKTLAAFHGQTVKAFILTRLGLDEMEAPSTTALAPAEPTDDTDYLFSTPANAAHLEKALQGQPEGRLKFDTLEDVKRALGI